jgi:PPM family protein phosphatase
MRFISNLFKKKLKINLLKESNYSPLLHYHYEYAVLTDKGIIRENNEDYVSVLRCEKNGIVVAALADGMGGAACGEVASKMCVEECLNSITNNFDSQKVRKVLHSAISTANAKIFDCANANSDKKGMGTTICLLLLWKSQFYWAWVGDSRIYYYNGDEFRQITRDDTYVNFLIDEGELQDNVDPKDHPEGHILAQAVGTKHEVREIHTMGPERINTGDRFLLASDGLYDVITSSQLKNEMSNYIMLPHFLACKLISSAKLSCSQDNISAVVVDVYNIDKPLIVTSVAKSTKC